jgi:twinkle protein
MSRVTDYLDRKGFSYRIEGAEAKLNCIFCSPPDTEQKFNINVETGLWRCWHSNRCGKSGTFWQLQKDLGDEPQGLQDSVKKVRRQYASVSQNGVHTANSDTLKWLASRKLTAETARRFSIGQTEGGEITFPYLRDNRLVNRKYRRLPKSFRQEKDAMPCLFARDLVTKDADTLLIVEGELDCLAAWQYGLEAVSVPSGASDFRWVGEEWDFLKRFKRLLLALDGDEAGENGVEALQKRLGWTWDLYRVNLPHKDLNDCLMAGVGEDEIRGCLQQAESLRPPEVKSLGELAGHLADSPDPGLPCEIPGLTEKLGGWRAGELTIHGGEAASGKTTATCLELVGLLQRRQRVCVASLEMPVGVLIQIMARQAGLPMPTFTWTYGEDLYFIDVHGSLEVDRLLELMAYTVQRFGVQHFVVDSLGCLSIDTADYWLLQKNVVARLVRFARDNSVHVHLVHHLRKPGKEVAGTRVRHSDLEGSAWIRNLVDNVLLYKRIREEDRKRSSYLAGADAAVLVDKNRFNGEEGTILLAFDRERRRFSQVGAPVGEQAGLESQVRKRARRAVQSALERGELVKPEACEGCGAPGPVEAHHEDYSKPLDVRWLCPGCHGAADRTLTGRVPAGVRG